MYLFSTQALPGLHQPLCETASGEVLRTGGTAAAPQRGSGQDRRNRGASRRDAEVSGRQVSGTVRLLPTLVQNGNVSSTYD